MHAAPPPRDSGASTRGRPNAAVEADAAEVPADAAAADLTARPLDAIAGFAALLRAHGLQVGVAEQQAFVRAALAWPAQQQPQQLPAAWRAIACHDRRAWRLFPELFERYWQPQRATGRVRSSGHARPAPGTRDLRQLVQALQQDAAAAGTPAPTGAAAVDSAADGRSAAPADDDAPATRAQGGASRVQALHDRSLSEWLPQDLSLLEQLAERLAARLRRRLTRRWRAHAQGRRLDLRRTLRENLRHGGEPVAPAWRRPRRERVRLFILVDVSRSMQTHAQLFLRIARAFVTAAHARVFVFHTRLAEVTPLLRRDTARVQEKVNAVTAGFGGGTRIATSVDDFARVHARGQLGRGARVWILSDGFDADPPEQLASALQALRGRGARLTWWHPSPRPPASRAATAARPCIDRFLRLDRLADLAAAGRALA